MTRERGQITAEAKGLLSSTIRALRERLLRDIHDAAEGEYRLSLPLARANLPAAQRVRRQRLETWLDERARALAARTKPRPDPASLRERLRLQAEKEAAATLLLRLVVLRHMEALGLRRPALLTGGWDSPAYREWRDFAPALTKDETAGYDALLRLVFDELSLDLPGLFGDVGLCRLFPVPAAALREVIERLDDRRLASAWTDDTTLGWVYQYWNDPEREALDAKIARGEKIEPHEIASKTQMFTERYMVEWLLHNTLGALWLALCQQHGWTPEASAVLPALDQRRAAFRARRERGEVPPDALLPIESDLEERWKYHVPQPLVGAAPADLRALKILDPACGSGHFLVIAFDLLAALYREEARHRGVTYSEAQIAAWILEHNLHGVDIDPQAIRIAAAGLYLKACALSSEVKLRQVNLVAPALNLADLPKDDPALVQLRRELSQEAGLPEELTARLLLALSGVDHLGTLLRVDAAVEEALRQQERTTEAAAQGGLFSGFPAQQVRLGLPEQRATVLDKLERFLSRHRGEGDLGLRLDGEQLADGVRFVRIVKEGSYDLVIGNPPYQGTSKMADAAYVARTYPKGKADLYAAFLERGLQLAKPGGLSALLTMRGWLFLSQFAKLREDLLTHHDLRLLGDVDRGAFDEVPNEVLAAAMTVFRRSAPSGELSVALQPTPLSDKSYDRERTSRKRAAVLAQVGRFEFDVQALSKVDESPVLYWWSSDFTEQYARAKKIEDITPVKQGMATGNNERFLRYFWEIELSRADLNHSGDAKKDDPFWVPMIGGAEGRAWLQELQELVLWRHGGLQLAISPQSRFGRGGAWYFRRGIAFSMIGTEFSARAHRYESVIGNKGSSVYTDDIPAMLCMMNSSASKFVLQSLNPGISFEVGDVNRLPIFPIESADEIYATVERAFSEHEAARETSVEFRRPSPSPWVYAQAWAQSAVDRPAGTPLPPYQPQLDPPSPAAFVSYAFGVALGRFAPAGQGLRDASVSDRNSLPAGILFLSAATPDDGLAHPACALLRAAWEQHGPAIASGTPLRDYLRKDFFAYHRVLYEGRPIYFPLSSAKRSFVAWVAIHRWQDSTLASLLIDHLLPERRRLDGELEDLRRARAAGEAPGRAKAERRYADLQKLLDELLAFMDQVSACAERGPAPSDDKAPRRQADAPYRLDLDDGVMSNSAALWPLLDPQWKDPKKWWRELCAAQDRKDYDWSHQAARYFPQRVESKCKEDPSLAVAHRCIWRHHPARAYAWELRLQDELRPGFTIDEPEAHKARAQLLAEHPDQIQELERAERKRRERKAQKAQIDLLETEEAEDP